MGIIYHHWEIIIIIIRVRGGIYDDDDDRKREYRIEKRDDIKGNGNNPFWRQNGKPPLFPTILTLAKGHECHCA